MNHRRQERGFVALMSVIVICAILLAIVYTIGAASFFSRFDSLDMQDKRESEALAQACVNVALLKILQNQSYAGGESVTVDTDGHTCTICTFSPGEIVSVPVRAAYEGTYTDLVVAAKTDGTNILMESQAEVPENDGCAIH